MPFKNYFVMPAENQVPSTAKNKLAILTNIMFVSKQQQGAQSKIEKVFPGIFFENFRNLDKNKQKRVVNTRSGIIIPLNFPEFKSRAAVAKNERYISADERDQHNEIKAESYPERLRERIQNVEVVPSPSPISPLSERVRQPVNAPIKGETARWTREIDTQLISREPHRVSVATASRDYNLLAKEYWYTGCLVIHQFRSILP